MPGRQQLPPLAREKGVQDIGHSVQCEEPHEEEVIAEAFRKLELKMESFVEPRGKEPEECPGTEPDAIDAVCIQALVLGVGPINEETRVDHYEKQWEVDPMHPADSQ